MSNERTPADDAFSRRIDRAYDDMIEDQYRRMAEGEDRREQSAPAAPVTDAEIEAAIEAVAGAQYGIGYKDAEGWPRGRDASKDIARFEGAKHNLRALIARRLQQATAAAEDLARAVETFSQYDDGAIGRPCIGSTEPDEYGPLLGEMRTALAAFRKAQGGGS